MIGKIFFCLVLVSVLFGALGGRMEAVGAAAVDGAGRATELALSLCGMMGLWGGVMKVLEQSGAVGKLTKLLRPLLCGLFPNAFADETASGRITACLAANLLGLGNAATPLAVSAMERMRALLPEQSDRPSDDMILFTVMNTAPISLLPTTVLALLRSGGAADPFAVLVPIWICSVAGCGMAVLSCRCMAMLRGRHKQQKDRQKRRPFG